MSRGLNRVTPDFHLVPLREEDAAALMAFETENREWFEAQVPPRPEGYFSLSGLRVILREILTGPEAGEDRFFLMRSGDGEILGRANLTGRHEGPEGMTAAVGYRVARAQAGRGLARAALGELLAEARGWGLDRLEATVAVTSPASRRVLETNGFSQTGRVLAPVRLNEAEVSLHHFARDL